MNADYVENIIRNIDKQSYKCILVDGAWGIGKSYDQLLLGKHTVKGVCSGGQPATAGFVVLISMYSAMRLNSSANLNLTLMFPFS